MLRLICVKRQECITLDQFQDSQAHKEQFRDACWEFYEANSVPADRVAGGGKCVSDLCVCVCVCGLFYQLHRERNIFVQLFSYNSHNALVDPSERNLDEKNGEMLS